jgi:hypothetical protein
LASLDVNEFGAWQREAGIPELALMLLLGWDPDGERQNFPESLEHYGSEAHSLILGLRMGDTTRDSRTRLRRHNSTPPTGEDRDSYSDSRLTVVLADVETWLPRSLTRWWRRRLGTELRSLPFHCHLIKYDPARSVGGHFDDGSWTDYSDIGSVFGGVTLTRRAYERVEQAHLDAIETMAKESEARSFVVGLDHDRDSEMDLGTMLDHIRGALRNENDERLWRTPQNSMYVTVGYDYHLYVGSDRECPAGVAAAVSGGLHPRPEAGPSPSLWIE